MLSRQECDTFKFVSLLHLSDADMRKLKLTFNSDWDYDANAWLELRPKLGDRSGHFDLFDMYCSGRADIVRESVKTHKLSRKRFKNGEVVFCFIPYSSNKDWLLVNAYKVINDNKILIDTDEESLAEYAPLFGRLVVHFKDKGRNIIVRNRNIIDSIYVKTILEQPCYAKEATFPGYNNVRGVAYADLKDYLNNSIAWQEKLKERRGIYVIGDRSNGKLYVGSATGKDGIYGRWYTYIKDGYDRHEKEDGKYPNKELEEIAQDPARGMEYIQNNFQYSILETFTEAAENDDILKRERWWKDVLLSRCKYGGYNAN